MASVNKVIVVGNLGKDPETRFAPSGGAICNVRIATTRNWKDKATGEKRYATRVLAQSVGVSLTFARVTGIARNAPEHA